MRGYKEKGQHKKIPVTTGGTFRKDSNGGSKTENITRRKNGTVQESWGEPPSISRHHHRSQPIGHYVTPRDGRTPEFNYSNNGLLYTPKSTNPKSIWNTPRVFHNKPNKHETPVGITSKLNYSPPFQRGQRDPKYKQAPQGWTCTVPRRNQRYGYHNRGGAIVGEGPQPSEIESEQTKKSTLRKRGRRGGTKHRRKDTKPLGSDIFNLSSHTLTQDEIIALDRGLKYAPHTNTKNFQLFIDTNLFVRKLNIKKFFATANTTNHAGLTTASVATTPEIRNNFVSPVPVLPPSRPIRHTKFKNNSTFNPAIPNNNYVETFKKLMFKDIRSLDCKKKGGSYYLNQQIHRGTNSLSTNENLVIKPADKGGGIVILNKTDYKLEMENLLSDVDTYQLLQGDPTSQYKSALIQLINEGMDLGILTAKEAAYLVPSAPRLATLYYLPKVHKNPSRPPGRPIVSGVDSLTSRLGAYLDSFLQPLVLKLQSYTRDSTQIIQILQDVIVDENTILATVDVTSLYTVIPHDLGMRALRFFFDSWSDINVTQVDFLMKCFEYALHHNYFWYSGNYYLQCRGVAMGARYAPSLANLYVGLWEMESIYHDHPPGLRLWKRYIDDVMILWQDNQESFDHFFHKVNNNDRNLRFTLEQSLIQVHFLDLTITKKGSRLETTTYFKPTDRNGYVPYNSCHYGPWLRAIPKSQFTRIRRNCSTLEDFWTQGEVLKRRFIEKNYPEDLIQTEMNKIAHLDRESLFMTKVADPKDNRAEDGPLFITQFGQQSKDVVKILNKHWDVLRLDPVLSTILPTQPRVVFRRAPTIANKVVRSYIDPPKPRRENTLGEPLNGFFSCGKCMACRTSTQRTRKTVEFGTNDTTQRYKIRSFITCKTTHAVYLIQCPCGLQYVGRTSRSLAIRWREHIYNVKKGVLTHSLSAHYAEKHHSDPSSMIFCGIDVIKKHWRGNNLIRELSKLETSWIFHLNTSHPFGLNIELDINCFLDNS